jgi:hypothetical protein
MTNRAMSIISILVSRMVRWRTLTVQRAGSHGLEYRKLFNWTGHPKHLRLDWVKAYKQKFREFKRAGYRA